MVLIHKHHEIKDLSRVATNMVLLNGHDKDFLFLVDDEANVYTSVPKDWQLIDSDGSEERGDVVGFLKGKRYLFEGGSNRLIAVAEE